MARDLPSGTPAPSERPCERHGEVVDFGGQRIGTGPCLDRDGRPAAHSAYVVPARGNRILMWSLAAATLPFVLVALYFAGPPAQPNRQGPILRAALAPADTAGPHTLAKLDCAQCHRQAHNVEDVRCERCHDPLLTARLSNAAHVFQGTGDLPDALARPEVTCATCHVEHRGANVNLADVDDRECGTCHRAERTAGRALTSLARHPEFAMVRAGTEIGTGLRWFNHQTHLTEVAKKGPQQCDACHQRSAGAPSFQPVVFVKHCASCHEEDLGESAGTLTPSMIAALGRLPTQLRLRPDPDDPGRQAIAGFRHADPWVVRTVNSLRMAADPTGVAAERTLLDRQVAQLELATRFAGDTAEAGAWTNAPRDTPPDATGSTTSAGSPDGFLREQAQALATLSRSLVPLDPAAQPLADDAGRRAQAAAPVAGGTPESAAATTLQQVRQMIEATVARAQAANNQNLADRARRLQLRLDQLSPASDEPRQVPRPTEPFDLLLRELSLVADPGVRGEVAELAYLSRLARQTSSTSIDSSSFDIHRQQTLQLLDAVQAATRSSSGPGANAQVQGLRARASALRHQALATVHGVPSETAAARARFFAERQRQRSRVDSELDAAGLLTAGAAPPADDPRQAQRHLEQLRQRLLAVGTARPPATAISAADARGAIAALLGREARDAEENVLRKNRCTLCHELTPRGDQLAPVRAPAGSLLVNASFTHEHHVTSKSRDNCATCHTGILESTAARDLNLPGIASCRTCHTAGNQAANATGCESCHKYHALPAWALMWKPWRP